MAERTAEFIQSVREGLADLPADLTQGALDYYEEFIAEALESGISETEVLKRLGRATDVVAAIRAERFIDRAEQRPGPLGLIQASGKAFGGYAFSAGRLLLAIGPLCMVLIGGMFYITAVLSWIGALASIPVILSSITQIVPEYWTGKLSLVGTGFIAFSLLAGTGVGFWQAADWMTKLTMRWLRRLIQPRPNRKPQPVRNESEKMKPGMKILLRVCCCLFLAGVPLLFSSDLPVNCFTIWNSWVPGDLTSSTREFVPEEIRRITINTLNSRIEIEPADIAVIKLTYGQPEWMDCTLETRGGELQFTEKSAGKIPYMNFIARHEGMTVIRLEVPRRYAADAVELVSIGGHMILDLRAESIQASTGDGNIRYRSRGPGEVIRAGTQRGSIWVRGAVVGKLTFERGKSGRPVVLWSDGGKIEIE